MAVIFDGKEYARLKEKELKEEVKNLDSKPLIVSILVGNDKASLIYTNLKKKAAARVGIKFTIKKFTDKTTPQAIITFISTLNKDKKVSGIMVQLPLPKSLEKQKNKILESISKEKDVDGLTKNSPYMSATVKAVKSALELATKDLSYFGKKAAVVGAKGTVGKSVVKMLTLMKYKVNECDIDTRDLYAKLHEADLVVSATGSESLIRGEMLKEGVIAIDVGSPKGDFEFKSVSPKAVFITPVPGGIGPLTIVSLLENVVETAS